MKNVNIGTSSLSKKNIETYFDIYILATLFVLIPGCINPTSEYASVGFIAGVLLILLLTKDINKLSFYFIILIINSSLTELPMIATQVSVLTPIYLFFIVIFILNIGKFKKQKRMIVPMAFYVLWVLYQIVNALYNKNINILEIFWGSTIFLIGILMQILVIDNENYQIHFLMTIVIAALIMCVTGYVELVLGKTFFYSLWKGDFYRYGILRMGSTVADANFLALTEISMLFIICTKRVKNIFGNRFINILSIFIILQIFLTVSRTGIFGLSGCFILKKICEKKDWALKSVPLIFLGMILLPTVIEFTLGTDVESSNSRIRIIIIALEYWQESMIIGHGACAFLNNSYEMVGSYIDTMNVFVQQLVNYGLIGLGFYVINVVYILKLPVKELIRRNNIYELKRSSLMLVSIVGWMVMSFSLDTFSKIIFWMFPAVIISLYDDVYMINEG